MSKRRTFPYQLTSILSFVFFFSGFSALIYQVAWQRLLTLHYGVETVSTVLIVSVYMFGLGLGALGGGFFSERSKDLLRGFFIIQILIAFFGFLSLSFMDILGRKTAASSYVFSLVCIFSFLSIPTFLMGMTLPILTKIFNRESSDFFTAISFLYFLNTMGAVLGAVFASYILISLCGLDGAVYCAVLINVLLCIFIYLASFAKTKGFINHISVETGKNQRGVLGWLAYPLVLVTGFLAVGYEMIWFRLIGVLVKCSPYAFSSILSVYLLGIALGSFGVQKYLGRNKAIDKQQLFFSLQFFIGVSVAIIFIGYYYLTRYTSFSILSHLSFNLKLHPPLQMLFVKHHFAEVKHLFKMLFYLLDVFFWPFFFMFIPTFFMGASFPLISYLALRREEKEGQTVGVVYFFNIAGNVMGGVLTGLVLLPFWGTERTSLGFILLGFSFGFFALGIGRKRTLINLKRAMLILLCIVVVFFFPKQGAMYRVLHIKPGRDYKTYFQEGREGVVMTYQKGQSIINYIQGIGHGGRPLYQFYFETIEALSFTPKMEEILIIGYGTGTITETVLLARDVKKVTQVELNRTLLKNLEKISLFHEMLNHPKINLVIDDARRYLLRTDKQFDLILMDPLRTTTAYSNNLYSRQFFELVQGHLKKDGILLVWMDEYRVMSKTISKVFKHLRFYAGQSEGFCLASQAPLKQRIQTWRDVLVRFPPQEQKKIVAARLQFLGNEDFVKRITSGYPINEDWRPVNEYYLGLMLLEWRLKKKISFYVTPR